MATLPLVAVRVIEPAFPPFGPATAPSPPRVKIPSGRLMSEAVIETAAPFPGVCVALNASPPRATTEKEVLLGMLDVPRLTLPPAFIDTPAALPPPLPPDAAMPPGTLTAPLAELAIRATLPPAVPFDS